MRECDVIHHLRIRQRISVNHIASILSRSVDTIQRACQLYEQSAGAKIDNRRASPTSRTKGRIAILSRMARLRLGAKFYLKGLFDNLTEAFTSNISKQVGDYILGLTENTGEESLLDPA